MTKITTITLSTLLFFASVSLLAQCADEANIYSFEFDGTAYEVVKENQTWVNAAACASERGGFLAEINSQEEQDAVYGGVLSAGIDPENTIAPDGGGASYLWLGGNDLVEESKWMWDGANNGDGTHFFQGTYPSGQPVNGAFVNWGNEPDNWGNQDALGLAITNWPLGVAGQWNDVAADNQLYYVIELEPEGIDEQKRTDVIIYPNPVDDLLFVKQISVSKFEKYNIYNTSGQLKFSGYLSGGIEKINVETIGPGFYVLKLYSQDGNVTNARFIK